MQKVKTIQIGQRSFTLKELPVLFVWELMNNPETVLAGDMVGRMQNLLALACPELTTTVLLELYPSEIEELWHGFEEVNAAFLGAARLIGMIDVILDGIRTILAEEFKKVVAAPQSLTEQSVASLPAATEHESGTTATASS